MQPNTETAPPSKKMLWAGYIISTLPVLMLVFSAVMKLIQPSGLVDEFTRLGWTGGHAVPLGIVELVCTLLYAIPQTAVLGAILLTGYLGDAVATHARLSEQFIGPVAFGVLVWLGICLRDPRLRVLIPWRR